MAESSVVGTLRALLTLDSAQFEKGMRQAQAGMQAFSREAQSVGRQATQLGTQLSKTLTLPILGFGGAMAKAAIDFESSFAGIKKTVNGTAADFAMLATGMRALSKEIPINVNELNKIGESAGQLGIKTENILGFTKVMAQLGVTTNLSSDQAASSLARLANITQMPQNSFDRLGATIVALGNNFATTESEIVDFGLRIAGAGHQAHMSEADILGIGAAMSSVGVEAEAGGTAVQKVLLDMVKATVQGNKDLAVFAKTAGMSAQEFKAAFQKDAAGAFTAFVEGLGRQGQSAINTLAALGLEDQRLIRSFLALSGAGDLLRRAIDKGNDGWRQNSALTNEAAQRFNTTASQLTLLWNRVKDVAITVGNALLPTIKDMVALFTRMVPLMERAGEAFAGLPAPVRNTAVAGALLLAALGPAVYVFGQLTLSAAAIAGAFGKTGLASTLLIKPLTALLNTVPVLTARVWLMEASVGALAGWFVGLPLLFAAAWKGMEAGNKTLTEQGIVLYGTRQAWEEAARGPQIYVDAIEKALKSGVAFDAMDHHDKRKIGPDATIAGSGMAGVTREASAAAVGLAADLAAARLALANLTAEQRRNIAAGLELTIEHKKIADSVGTTEAVVDLFAKAQTAATKAAKDGLASYKSLTEALAGTRAAVANLTENQRTNIAAGVALGLSTDEIATKMKLGAAVVEMYADSLKDVESALKSVHAAMPGVVKDFQDQINAKQIAGQDRRLSAINDRMSAERRAATAARDIDFQRAEFEIEQAKRAHASWQQIYEMERALAKKRLAAQIDDENAAFKARTALLDRSIAEEDAEYRALETEHNLIVGGMTEVWRQGEILKRQEAIKTHALVFRLWDSIKGSVGQLGDAAFGNLSSLIFGFGKDNREFKIAADKAHQEFLRLQRSGKATAEELTLAFQRWHEAEDRANHGFADRFRDVWQGIKQSFENILNDMLKFFVESFLKQLVAKIVGARIATKLGLGLTDMIGGGTKLAGAAAGIGSGASSVAILGAGAGSVTASGGAVAAGNMVTGTGMAGVGGAGGSFLTNPAFYTNPYTLAAIGGIALAVAIWKKGLFRGGEEALKVNPNRDKFFGQFGPPGWGAGSGRMNLAAKLTAFGAGPGGGSLMSSLNRADKEKTFHSAEDNIIAFFAQHGVRGVKKFNLGGFVPPGAVVPAVLHGGSMGEYVVPASKMASSAARIVVEVHNHISTLDRKGVKAFIESPDFIDSVDNAFQNNHQFITTRIGRALKATP